MDVRCGQTGRWLADLCLKMLSIMLLNLTRFSERYLTAKFGGCLSLNHCAIN